MGPPRPATCRRRRPGPAKGPGSSCFDLQAPTLGRWSTALVSAPSFVCKRVVRRSVALAGAGLAGAQASPQLLDGGPGPGAGQGLLAGPGGAQLQAGLGQGQPDRIS